MSLTSPNEVRRVLEGLGAHPSKALGQNFLIDRNILDILLAAASLEPTDNVLEIGPGLGVLTEALLQRVRTVRAVEKDRALAAHLRERLVGQGNVRIELADALGIDLRHLPGGGIDKVVSNLPYNVASRILMELALCEPPAVVVVTVQREVADRVVAAPSRRAFGLMSLWLQCVFEAEIVKTVSPTCFWPPPAVQSAIVRLVRRARPRLPAEERRPHFYLLTRYAFMHRRKQLGALLAQAVASPALTSAGWHEALAAVGLDSRARPGELAPEQWLALLAGPLATAHLHEALCRRRRDALGR